MAEDQEVAFDDWEAALQQQPESDSFNPQQEITKTSLEPAALETENKQSKSTTKATLQDKLKEMTDQDFENECRDKNESSRVLCISPPLLKNQADFIRLSTVVANKLKKTAENQPEKTIPQKQLLVFFEEMLLYLYPKYGWENIEYAKQKLKIVKKDRKQDENRARKLKQKEQRLRQAKKKEQNFKEETNSSRTSEKEVTKLERGQFQQQGM